MKHIKMRAVYDPATDKITVTIVSMNTLGYDFYKGLQVSKSEKENVRSKRIYLHALI